MPRSSEQSIIVKIKALVEGLASVRELGRGLEKLQSTNLGGAKSGEVAQLSTQLDKLSKSIDKVASGTKKVDSTKFAGLVRVAVGISAVVQTLANVSAAVEGAQKIVAFFKAAPELAQKTKDGFTTAGAAVAGFAGLVRSKFTGASREAATSSATASSGVSKFTSLVQTSSARIGVALSSIEKRFASLRSKASLSLGGSQSSSSAANKGEDSSGGADLGVVATQAAPLLARGSAKASEAVASLVSQLGKLGLVGVGVAAALTAVVAVVSLLAAGVAGLAVSVGIGLAALLKIGPAGIALNSQLEQTKLGIAAIITSLAQIENKGIPLNGAEKFAAATVLAADQLQKLRIDAINTVATFDQIAPAFQEALAPGLAAGLTIDEVRRVTVQVVQAATALNIPLHQVNQEVRAILEGNIDINARLAKALGIKAEHIKKWKQEGTLAEELNKRLEGFALAGIEAANSLEGLKSNLQEALNVFNTEATTRAFAALKAEFKRLLPELFDFKNSAIQEKFKVLAHLADDVLTSVIRIGGEIAQDIVSGLRKASDFVSNNRSTINDILNLVGIVFRQLISIGKIFVRVGTDTSVWKGTLDAAKGVLVLISVILETIGNKLREIEPLLRLAALAAVLLIQSEPTLAALSRTPIRGGSFPGQEEIERSNAKLEELRVKGLPKDKDKPTGGGGKVGSSGPSLREKLEELVRQLNRTEADISFADAEARFNDIKDLLDREKQTITQALEDRLVSYNNYYAALARIETESIEQEIQRQLDALDKIETERKQKVAEIAAEKGLKPGERVLKETIAANEATAAAKPILQEIKKLERDREDVAKRIADEARKTTEEYQRQISAIQNDLLRFEGRGAEAAKREIDEQFREMLERATANGDAAGVAIIQATKKRLKRDVDFKDLEEQISNVFQRIRDAEAAIDADVNIGAISPQEGIRRKLEAARLMRAELEGLHGELRGVAEATKDAAGNIDPLLIDIVNRLGIEIAQVGVAIDETAKRIDDTLRSGLEDTLVSIITRTKSVGEAFRDLARTILLEIARILAAQFVEKLFGGILRTNTGGTSIGGILAGILTGGASSGRGGGGGGGSTGGGTPPFNPNNFLSIIKGFQSGTAGRLDGLRSDVHGGFGQTNSKLETSIGLLGNILSAVASQGTSFLQSIVTAGISVVGSVLLKRIENRRNDRAPVDIPGSAMGGPITGPGTGISDSILARLSNGEFVIREWATKRLGVGALNFINNFGRLPEAPRYAFAFGGAVGDIASLASPAVRDGDGAVIAPRVTVNINTPNPAAFKGSESTIKRDLARAVTEGIRRSKSGPK